MRGSITVSPCPCARKPASTASRISSSVSASCATSGPFRYVRNSSLPMFHSRHALCDGTLWRSSIIAWAASPMALQSAASSGRTDHDRPPRPFARPTIAACRGKMAAARRRRSPRIRQVRGWRRSPGGSASPTSKRTVPFLDLPASTAHSCCSPARACGWPGTASHSSCGHRSSRLSSPGDGNLSCSLVDGPVRDFNLMVRRGAARGSVVIRRERGAPLRPPTLPVLRRRGRFRMPGSRSSADRAFRIPFAAGNAGVGMTAHGLVVNPIAAGSVALVAAIRFE